MPIQQIILASASPYRKALLARLFDDFNCESPAICESPKNNETAKCLALRLAIEKAQQVGKHHQTGIIIGSDQAAECNDQILGKPGNRHNAQQQLRQMRGHTVRFYTGLCVLNAATKQSAQETVQYAVRFRDLSDSEIEQYLDKEQAFDCAGSFKSEAFGISLVAEMSGTDPTALIGLPLICLCKLLRELGVALP